MIYHTYSELHAAVMASRRGDGTRPVALPWVLHDYLALTPDVTHLRFFDRVDMEHWQTNALAGCLPEPQFFDVATAHFGLVWPSDRKTEDMLRRLGRVQITLAQTVMFDGSLVNFAPLVLNLRKWRRFIRVWRWGLRWDSQFMIPPLMRFGVDCWWPPAVSGQRDPNGPPLTVGVALAGTLYRATF